MQNAEERLKGVRTLTRKKNVKKCVLVGDFNLPHINWSDGIGVSTIDNTFLNGFAECGMVQCIQNSTHKIATSVDCDILQRDIDTLNTWCIKNKMKFNTDKCKVLTVANAEPLFMNELPFTKYSYKLGDKILDYTSCVRDLGIFINERFDWHDHHNFILKKGNQMLGMTKRTFILCLIGARKECCILH